MALMESDFRLRTDIDQMPDTPTRKTLHRRAHSDTFFRFQDDSDDILLPDVVLPDFNLHLPGTESSAIPTDPMPDRASCGHLRSLSFDSDFFDGLNLTSPVAAADGVDLAGQASYRKASETLCRRHGIISVEGSVAIASLFEEENGKKALGTDRLAELALIDPKRAKRILANRQSAARSKERKIRYTSELERKVQTLQTEATTLSAKVTILQRDTTGLTQENKELKMRLQAMEQQAHLKDALNEALREEVQRLKVAAVQTPANNGNSFNRTPPLPPQYSTTNVKTTPCFGNSQAQEQNPPLHMPRLSISNDHTPGSNLLDFNQMV